ncbi:hypothetical protein B6N60_02362 [Richelia sinica FACHB-800]|uniref:PD-(D/E)XK endonuclease-like domain-containing protein n=1 Tax=Richelia sinica FACHB-800 TaxID=1357546 RepID=A0A975T903_9NOST|nr:PD-(D/E)XK nuclease family protein [Richelia sinica]QXE23672.1 hypothetical protein B6N60_02362 [Richelia sinica FACHB-800]
MLPTSNQLLRLSQGQLNLLAACPRKFQHTYLEQLTPPPDPQHEDHQSLGSRFHLLMQQREMGLPIENFLQADPQLQSWMSAFANAAPEILIPAKDDTSFRESEHYRTLQIKNYLLTVIYDLLIADDERAQILDWKTYPQPPNKNKLAQNWQTRLYLYVLVETSEYQPEDISMTYWFVQSQGKTKNIKFDYDIHQHQATAKALNHVLDNLTNWLEAYQNHIPFPQIPIVKNACEYCQYATQCERKFIDDDIISQSLSNFADIQEVFL